MKVDQYDVHLSDGEVKSFNANSVTDAWLRGMSYGVVTNKQVEVKHIVNHATMEIFTEFAWDVSFTAKDIEIKVTGPNVIYNEIEVWGIMSLYAKFVGNSLTHALDWFNRNKKLK